MNQCNVLARLALTGSCAWWFLTMTAPAAEILRVGPPMKMVIQSAASVSAGVRQIQGTREPSIYDQYMLELINRGRADPNAEAVRYACDLNEGLSAGTISSDPKQPLAFSPNLIYAANEHCQWMVDNNTFSHTGAGGSTPEGRMTAAGYAWTSCGENLAQTSIPSLTADLAAQADQLHLNLYVDSSEAGRGHRLNLMNENWREMGVSLCEGVYTVGVTNYFILMETEDYGVQSGNPFLTGVVYTDLDRNNFYTPGEGVNYPTISAVNQSTQQVYTTTGWYSGGYSLQVPAGTYSVTASGGGLSASLTHTATVGSLNIKVDFVPANTDNVAPLIQSGPTAGISGLTATLSVTASDADGDSLTYTWSALSGPAAVVFSPNGTDASSTSTATFTATGDYVIQIAVSDGQHSATDTLPLTISLDGTALANRVATAGSTATGTPFYYFDVPAGCAAVTFATSGTSANLLDLGVNLPTTGTYPTTVSGSDSHQQGQTYSGNETVIFASPSAGRYYVLVKALATGNFTLTASYNRAPTAATQTVSVATDTSVAVTLSGSDADGDALTYTIASSPMHGALSGTAPNLTYTAAAGYAGVDSFTFTAGDGQTTSAVAAITLTIFDPAADPVAQFITRFYQLCLGRTPDSAGLNGWVGNLKSGADTGADAGNGFIFSAEFQAHNLDNSAWLDVLYQAFFNRAADAAGKSGWLAQLDGGTSKAAVLNGFTHGTEFVTLCAGYSITPYAGYGSDPVEQFVTRFYQLCLGRDPDTAGLNSWVNNLKSGASTGANVGSGFIFSAEFTGRHLDNSTWLDVLYQAFFNRAADAAGKNGWQTQLNSGTSQQAVLDGFTHGGEFSTLCNQYGIRAY